MIAVKIGTGQLLKLQGVVRHIADGVPRVLAPAINRALDHGRTTVKREIRKEYVIKAKDIPVAVRGANATRLSGAVIVAQPMLDLNKFKISPRGVQHRKHRIPIKATVRAGGGKLIAHGFVALMPTGYLGPFVRKNRSPRYPIRKLITIGAGIMASKPVVAAKVQAEMTLSLAKNIDSQIARILAKK